MTLKNKQKDEDLQEPLQQANLTIQALEIQRNNALNQVTQLQVKVFTMQAVIDQMKGEKDGN